MRPNYVPKIHVLKANTYYVSKILGNIVFMINNKLKTEFIIPKVLLSVQDDNLLLGKKKYWIKLQDSWYDYDDFPELWDPNYIVQELDAKVKQKQKELAALNDDNEDI